MPNTLDQFADALQVAGGNRSLQISIDTESLVWVGMAVFIAMLAAMFIAGFILT